MKAMILAAGIGLRLKPLTDKTPKALIKIGEKTMLELVLARLVRAGVSSVVINLFHLADQVQEFLNKKAPFPVPITISKERELLDTGGGLKKAAPFFDDGQPFFVHNVDVLSDIDLDAMYRHHLAHPALATLAVQKRPSSRALLFDSQGRLCGRQGKSAPEWAGRPKAGAKPLAFSGIHVVSPELFPKMTESGIFPIMEAYLRLAGEGETIRAFNAGGAAWNDIGTPARLEEARRTYLRTEQ